MAKAPTEFSNEKIENVGTQDGPVNPGGVTSTFNADDGEIAKIKGVNDEDTKRLQDRARAGLGLTDAMAELPAGNVTGPGEEESKTNKK